MKPFHLLVASVGLAVLGLGCGASVHKSELYAAYGDDGTPTYYRITLDASGFNGAVEYRAGWYNAAAVDELFGDLASDSEMRSDMAKTQREAVAKTMKAYLDALVDHADDDGLLAKKKNAFEAALAALGGGAAPAGASPMTVLDYAQKKFVIVLSLRPDEVIAAIKGQVQKRQLLDAVKASLAARGDADAEVLSARLQALDRSVQDASDDLDGALTNEALLKTLSTVQAEAEVIP